MDDWVYLERRVVVDPHGREWSVAVMDLLGQEGDVEMPGNLQAHYPTRYYTLVYAGGGVQYERGHAHLAEARQEFEELAQRIASGHLNPAQPTFRADLND